MQKKCGLLGKSLRHSYSKEIHAVFGDYEYSLLGVDEDKACDIIKNGDFAGLNVTIPYKKLAYSLCDVLSEDAQEVGSVNTVVRRGEKIYGDNTDIFGFEYTLNRAGIDISKKKVLILGSGGTSSMVQAISRRLGAEATVVSRSGEVNYENAYGLSDTEVIINTTPVGMYPNNGVSPIEISKFPNCTAVADVIYNPNKTAFLQEAERLGIANVNGMYMLAAQAKRSSEIFFERTLPDSLIERAVRAVWRKNTNVVLIGMPGSGKSTVGKRVAEILGRQFADTDEIISSRGAPPAQIIRERGEDAFREIEASVVSEISRENGLVIATGGGVVEREQNYFSLSQNGRIYLIKRNMEMLAREGRPLSSNVEQLYKSRRGKYERFADATVENNEAAERTAQAIVADFLK